MKKILKTILHSALLFGEAAAAVLVGSVPLALGLIPVMVVTSAKLADDLNGNEITDSIFSVSSNGVIIQNSLAKPYRTLKMLSKKNKNEAYKEETARMFTELKQKDKNGNTMIYRTISHAMTQNFLKAMKDNGYVNEFCYYKKKKSSLFLEKFLIGNTKGLFSKKKKQMYDMTFTLTDKERNYDELMSIKTVSDYIKEESNNDNVIERNKTNSNNKELTNEEKIRILQGQKELYEDMKYQKDNKNKKAL